MPVTLTPNPAAPVHDLVTVTIRDQAGNPVGDARVQIASDVAGQMVIGEKRTKSTGGATFLLKAYGKYFLWMWRAGFNPILGQAFVAQPDAALS